jgi:carboxypeptidase Q
MVVRSLAATLAFCAFLTLPVASMAADRGPSTPEERQQALEYIQHFESDPLNPDLKKEVRWVTEWMIQVPDIHTTLCLFVDLPKGDKKHSQTLFTSMVMAQTRFAIEHRDAAPELDAEFLAGMQGMLHAYEKVIAAYPRDREPALDDLVHRRDDGSLPQYLKERAGTTCKKNG